MFSVLRFAIISIRTFEVLLDMIHGGLTKPMLAILSEIFGQRWAAPLSEIMRLAFAVPPLLYPVWEFQLATKRKIFGLAFWDAHQPRKMAKDEVGFGVPENMVVAFKGVKSISDAWRIAAHRTMVKYGAGVDRSSEWWMQQDFEVESKLPVGQRREVCVARMKNMFGYRATLFFLATVGLVVDQSPAATAAALTLVQIPIGFRTSVKQMFGYVAKVQTYFHLFKLGRQVGPDQVRSLVKMAKGIKKAHKSLAKFVSRSKRWSGP